MVIAEVNEDYYYFLAQSNSEILSDFILSVIIGSLGGQCAQSVCSPVTLTTHTVRCKALTILAVPLPRFLPSMRLFLISPFSSFLQCSICVIAGEVERQTASEREKHHSQDLCRDGAPLRGQNGTDLRGDWGEVELPGVRRILQQSGQSAAGTGFQGSATKQNAPTQKRCLVVFTVLIVAQKWKVMFCFALFGLHPS